MRVPTQRFGKEDWFTRRRRGAEKWEVWELSKGVTVIPTTADTSNARFIKFMLPCEGRGLRQTGSALPPETPACAGEQ